MTARTSVVWVLFAVCLVAGCASADVMLVDPNERYTPTDGASILFEEPTRPHMVIAIIEGDGGQYTNQSKIVRAIQKKAAKIGAHAIMLLGTESTYVPTTTVANPVAGSPPITLAGGTKYKIRAVAIRYMD